MGRKLRAPKLSAVRKRIDRIDRTFLALLNRRAALALQIGRLKDRKRWPVYDARREAVVLRHVTRANRGPLSARAVSRVFQAVLRECRRREGKGKRR